MSDQVRALERVLALAGPGNANRIAAVNMSLRGGRYYDQASCDAANTGSGRKAAIDNLRRIGIASTISAGNSGYTDSLGAPGCISTAISVGPTRKNDVISPFSNRAPFLSLMAPGSAIVSSVPGNAFGSASGTSMAAPHAAGAWAILKQVAPGASVGQVLSALRSTGVAIPDGALTHRRIRVASAGLALLRSGAPQALTATVAGNHVTLNWAPPAGGAPAAYYTLLASATQGGPAIASFHLPPTATSAPVANVPPGSDYVQIVAANAMGAGPPSNVVTVNIAAPQSPGAPTLHPAAVSPEGVTLSWTPGGGGAATSYHVFASLTPGGGAIASLPVGATSITVEAPPGTYYVRVHGLNAVGPSPASNEITVVVPASIAAQR